MFKKSTTAIALIVLALMLAACGEEEIPPGQSDVLGTVSWIDGFSVAGLDVDLAGQKITLDEKGTFAFKNVENGIYSLTVANGDNEITEVPVVLREDIGDLQVVLGKNEFQWGSLEEYPMNQPVPPSSDSSSAWSANRQLGGPASEVDVVDNVARSGKKSIRVKGVTNADGTSSLATVRQWGRGLVSGGTYRLIAWFKTDPPVKGVPPLEDPSVYMRIRFCATSCNVEIRDQYEELFFAPGQAYFEDVGPAFIRVHPVTHENEWNPLFVEFKMPEGADRLLVEYSSRANWNDGQPTTIWWDDSSLVRID